MNKISRAGFFARVSDANTRGGTAPKDDNQNSDKNPNSSNLYPYTGPWGQKQILHLLRRSLFGVTTDDYNYFSGRTLNECLDTLLIPSPIAAPPVNAYNDDNYTDPDVPFGQTWVFTTNNDKGITRDKRKDSLNAWCAGLLLNQDRSLTEKMTLFLHNHVAASFLPVNGPRTSYTYMAPLRVHALGNFKKFVFQITTTPGMLQYLNADHNTAVAPNENYARELQELFTVGKGPGSHYTQNDVIAASRILTGWAVAPSQIENIFMPSYHDTGDKQFSPFYNNTLIKGRTGNAGTEELNGLIDMIFNTRETARCTCRKLYRWFVNSEIDETTEAGVIEPLASVLIKNNYELIPALRALLGSGHFFDSANMGNKIKSPADHLVGFCRQFMVNTFSTDIASQYYAWKLISDGLYKQAMCPGYPPSVAGWAAYYLFPGYDQLWINADTIVSRHSATDALSSADGMGDNETGGKLQFDIIEFTARLSSPADVHKLVLDSTALLSPLPFDDIQITRMKNIMETKEENEPAWHDTWLAYEADKTDAGKKSAVFKRLSNYYTYVLQQAECQLM